MSFPTCGNDLTSESRYNLKRRVASLPPLSSEVFAEKVLNAQASSSAAAAKASFERVCDICQRTYYSENAFQNHLASQKHKLRLGALRNSASASRDNETNSVISSTFSLGEPIETGVPQEQTDPDADVEFSKVVSAMKESSLDATEPISRRPTRPHHSSEGERPSHPISPTPTPCSTNKSTDDAASKSATSLLLCLFCNYKSPTLPLNVTHMGKIHGMFIPEQAYLTDLEGLVGYLHQKVFDIHVCLYCGKLKGTEGGVQTHMRDKGHCMIAFDSEEEMVEIGQFYDFRSTYSEADDDDLDDVEEDAGVSAVRGVGNGGRLDEKDAGGVPSNGAEIKEKDDDDADGWETDSSASSLDSADLTAVPLDHRHQYQRLEKHPHHCHNDVRPHHHKDGWHSHAHIHPHAVYYTDYELHLPSGRSVGHRSLARYYRQNLHAYPSSSSGSESRAITDGSAAEVGGFGGLRGRQLENRNLGMANVSDAKVKEVKAVEVRERKRENRERTRYQLGIEKRKNMQKHFRVSLITYVFIARLG